MDTDTIYTFHCFSGAGGGLLADMLLGHKPVGAIEIEAYPRKVLLARQLDGCLPRFPVWDDVRTFRSDNPDCAGYIERLRGIRDRLCISGGFPCQDISCAGKGAGITGERSGLWGEMARIIGEIRPRYVFVENSPMLTIRGGVRVIGDLAEMGYDCRFGIMGASDCGMPHVRKRIWIYATNAMRLRLQGSRKNHKKPAHWKGSRKQLEGLLISEARLAIPSGKDKRMSDGIPNRMDRLKAIGNGQVPAVAALAWRILTQ